VPRSYYLFLITIRSAKMSAVGSPPDEMRLAFTGKPVTKDESLAKVAPEDDEFPPHAHHTPNTLRNWFVFGFMTGLCGLIFGAAFAKSRVFEPRAIRGQFIFEVQIMIKMFIGAFAVSCFVLAALSKLYPKDFQDARLAWDEDRAFRGFRSAILGGLILGAGMAISGACPGMVLPQVGANVPNAWLTLVGGLIGALIYSILEPVLQPFLLEFDGVGGKHAFLDEYTPRIGFVGWSLIFGVGLVIVVALLEIFVPWEDDLLFPLEDDCSAASFWNCYAWPPSLAGGLIGALQVPVFLLLNTFLGSSTGYQALISGWVLFLSERLARPFTYARRFAKPTIDTHWQIFYVSFAILGAFLIEFQAGLVGEVPGVAKVYAFSGGFMMIFGSRLGVGCTSGAGISSTSILMLYGFVGMAFMFLGGIIVAFTIDAVDEDYYVDM